MSVPTASAVTALLRRAGFQHSTRTGPGKRYSEGFACQQGNRGRVGVVHQCAVSARVTEQRECRDAALAAYSAAIAERGWTVVTEGAGSGRHLLVTATDSQER